MSDLHIQLCNTTIDFPCECQILNITTLNEGFIFNDHSYYMWATLGSLTVFYAGAFFYLFHLRNIMAFKARSPVLIFIGVLLIYLDSIGTTLVFSNNASTKEWNRMCNMNIFVQQTIFFGAMSIYFIRMYRIYKVYRNYTTYLQEEV